MDQVPKTKICATLTAVPEQNVGRTTALSFAVETVLVDQTVVTSQLPETKLHYPV